MSGGLLEVRHLNFGSDRAHDQIDGDYYAVLVLAADEKSFNPGEWAIFHPHAAVLLLSMGAAQGKYR